MREKEERVNYLRGVTGRNYREGGTLGRDKREGFE